MIGESKEIGAIKEMIEKVAPTDARVLITGSNGTGKELGPKIWSLCWQPQIYLPYLSPPM